LQQLDGLGSLRLMAEHAALLLPARVRGATARKALRGQDDFAGKVLTLFDK
jgi:hypothetical protein